MKLKIIENFFDEKDLVKIKSLNLKKTDKNTLSIYHNSIDKNGQVKVECFSESLLRELHEKYHNKAVNILEDLNSEKVKLYEYSEFQIVETGFDCKFPIHDDTPNKLLSGVIYLSPNQNTGTIFYNNKKGEGKKSIDWKVNRGVFFSRIEGESWHSYEGDGKNNRLVMVYNLMTNNLKEVYKVEKKNYFLGLLRYKLNPYLYKFLKFTI